ncbi:hypothetical protein BegalDRAFT_1335 [Beggiatoa alba B18LD]|uniref:Pentapeptide MXKDX repeat protein n=1 Tax=Beggiatoa alba B18LD TaxID=395493 RepID=I3CF38_9GAMM|nr:hypothetical protein [Beggiatoa alba]EIJ42231.1 hypothetical protein BegalDRAFT_1335 [Beggiatoa alba B18LD]
MKRTHLAMALMIGLGYGMSVLAEETTKPEGDKKPMEEMHKHDGDKKPMMHDSEKKDMHKHDSEKKEDKPKHDGDKKPMIHEHNEQKKTE